MRAEDADLVVEAESGVVTPEIRAALTLQPASNA